MAEDHDEPREEDHEVEPRPSDEVAAAVLERFPGTIFADSHGQAVVYVDRAVWLDVATYLRDEQQFTQCLDVTAVDLIVASSRPEPAGVATERFEVVANFLSHPRNRRIRVITEVPAEDPTVASLTNLYPGLNFAEREVYDMFGVVFQGHPDLRRILMPEDYEGHPQRRDFPTGGEPVLFTYNEEHNYGKWM
jgi:NADH-quinone oxidoreductase subunit C